MIKCRVPKIPPLLVYNLFILISSVKARYSTTLFTKECTPIISNSVLPALSFLTNKRIDDVNRKRGNFLTGGKYIHQ